MEDLYYNLSKEEFSKGRKILIWLFASLITISGLWNLLLKILGNKNYSGLTISVILLTIGAFLFFVAILATVKRKEHFFRVNNKVIAYRFGLIFPSSRSFNWEEVKSIYFPPHSKKAILVMQNGNIITINLTWIEKNKSRLIIKHLYYTGQKKAKEIYRKNIKK